MYGPRATRPTDPFWRMIAGISCNELYGQDILAYFAVNGKRV